MVPPYCFLCNKWLFDPERGMEEGYEVTFADYVEPKDGEWIEELQGVKWFCEAHFPFARALSHLTSKEALRQLEEQFGTFPPLPVIMEESSRWRKLNDALFNGAFCKTPQNWVLSRADRQRVRAVISGMIWVSHPMIITPAHECYPRRTFEPFAKLFPKQLLISQSAGKIDMSHIKLICSKSLSQ